jgi:hypothetical protein
VADFFTDIYMNTGGWKRLLARIIQKADYAAWRQLPVIVTRARNTRDFLATRGVDPRRVHPIYDPCDTALSSHGPDRGARALRLHR